MVVWRKYSFPLLPMASSPFGKLFSNSVKHTKKYIKPILTGVIIFGVLTAGAQIYLTKEIETEVSNVLEDLGTSTVEMGGIVDRIGEGDEAAMEELVEKMAEAGKVLEGMDEMEKTAYMKSQAMTIFSSVLPKFGTAALVLAIIYLIGSLYYLVQATDKATSSGKILKRTISLILPIIGVSIIFAVISLVGVIPILGIIVLLIVMPRLSLACYLIAKEKKGVIESISLSWKRSKGYWCKIIGNYILFGIILGLITWGIIIVSASLTAISVLLYTIVYALAMQLISAFSFVFYVNLSETVNANPRK